jgi:hypothetical protein
MKGDYGIKILAYELKKNDRQNYVYKQFEIIDKKQ